MEVENAESESTEKEKLISKVRWTVPQRLGEIAFVGRDVLAVAQELGIVFLHLRTGQELVYAADGPARGDGVDVLAGYKSNMFAFAEKVKHARIFIMVYPRFNILTELKDNEVNRYKGLCLMENDLVAGFSGFPTYLVSVWSWRSGQRLLSLPTGVLHRRQMFTASCVHTLVCQCWGEGLHVWEVALCFKRCLMMRRTMEEATGREVSPAPWHAVCWTLDGELYGIDERARFYSLTSDGINMKRNLEWSEDIEGENAPCVCALGSGVLVYGPDENWLRKAEQKWTVSWKGEVCAGAATDDVVRLVGSAGAEAAAACSRAGRVLRLAPRHDDSHAIDVTLVAFKQRNIKRIQLIAPDYAYLATMSEEGVTCIYEIESARLVNMTYFKGEDLFMKASPTEPLLVVTGAGGLLQLLSEGAEPCLNYGLVILAWSPQEGLRKVASVCLTHQIVSRVAFSPTGRELMAAAMAAGHVFIYKLSEEYTLKLTRYAEVGRGLADCFLMKVGDQMRAFCLVLFSDKYAIGERIVCISAETGKDNKLAGKMQGPYVKLLPLSVKDTMLAIPHLSKQFHVLRLSGDKGVTVSVKMGPVVDSGHELRQFNGLCNAGVLLTFGADGTAILRPPDGSSNYDARLVMAHRYEGGIWQMAADERGRSLICLTHARSLVVVARTARAPADDAPAPPAPPADLLDPALHTVTVVADGDKNYLDLQEEKKVREEALDFKKQRDEVVSAFKVLQTRLVELLEENVAERPLHQLSLAEFNLHLENKKERLKAAEREREEIRLTTEARIRAQDKVTAWIKAYCWDTMLTHRVKLFAIFSHYHVENYPVLPTQRDQWPELLQTAALRALEMENDHDLFKPWEELDEPLPSAMTQRGGGGAGGTGESALSMGEVRESSGAVGGAGAAASEVEEASSPYVLAGTNTHNFIAVPSYAIPQTLAFSFLQMNYLCHITKINVQNMRLWFNKQFDELMSAKKREVGLVAERNARLRFIIEELNKLSDLRGSFHHLTIQIKDPDWRQEEEPLKLIKVEPEECVVPPYISPSQIVIVPPDPGPKDDFRERALIEMMDGVLEKLWHEEIKKPIPMPQCMLDKEPEQWNEEDLRQVFDYEAKVAFRNEERNKYRKMLHAEYAKLSQVLNEGIVKFNMRVKDMWLMKLRVDSVIGQENLNLMRLRRRNLDRVEASERLERLRKSIVAVEAEAEVLAAELALVQAQSGECQAAYDALAVRDRHMDRTFKNNFADVSPIVSDQCYKFFKRRPKWHQRATMTPGVLNELAACVVTAHRTVLLHLDCLDYFKGVEQLDQLSNMPAVMDEALWTTMCRLRRAKIENEIRMRALVLETGYVDAAVNVWSRALHARRSRLAHAAQTIAQHRDAEELTAINRTIQLVLPAGQVEIVTTGHMQDFEDASLIPKEDIDKINNLILKVGAIKLRMMRKQMEFRKGILAKEWEHAQMKMKLRHMQQELYSYQRLKIPKELQWYLKNKEKGYTDEIDYMRLEKELEATRVSFSRLLADHVQRAEELEVRVDKMAVQAAALDQLILALTVKVSEKRIHEDPLEPIRVRRILKKRMNTLVARSNLIREVQANHTAIAMLQTELELLRLKTYPTLASFRTIC